MKTYVLYHANCPDGFGAAWAAWRALDYLPDYIPVTYGKPIPSIEDGSRVFIVDFSYPRADLLALRERVAELIVLDHHKTAQAELAGLPFATFDMDKSGAILTWEHFHAGDPPLLLRYVEDRDLWRFDLPESREVAAALRIEPFDFELWSRLNCLRLREDGRTCLRMQRAEVETMARQARLMPFGGHEAIPVVNTTVHFSDVGELLLKWHPEAPFAAYYLDRADGIRQWGLRSRPDFDCSVVAKRLGGGGHAQAAGFQTEIGALV